MTMTVRKQRTAGAGASVSGKGTGAGRFEEVFQRLRAILLRNTGRAGVRVKEDGPICYCLEGGIHPVRQTAFPIAWVKVAKAYVSFHHMAVYARPRLLEGVSKELKARMQGKACFNFKSVDPVLFAELEGLTARGFAAFQGTSFMSDDNSKKRKPNPDSIPQ